MRGLTNRRAGCGKSARPVRREGWSKPMLHPYPYRACGCLFGEGVVGGGGLADEDGEAFGAVGAEDEDAFDVAGAAGACDEGGHAGP